MMRKRSIDADQHLYSTLGRMLVYGSPALVFSGFVCWPARVAGRAVPVNVLPILELPLSVIPGSAAFGDSEDDRTWKCMMIMVEGGRGRERERVTCLMHQILPSSSHSHPQHHSHRWSLVRGAKNTEERTSARGSHHQKALG